MATNIFQPLRLGSEVFHAVSYNDDEFIMDWTMETGGKVPPHIHVHMDEHFTVTKGEVKFNVSGKPVVKKVGEELLIPKGIMHSISNATKEQIGVRVTYTPCSDTHRMFEIMAQLNELYPGSAMNMVKYFYIYPRLGLKDFSTIPYPVVMSMVNGIVTTMGKVSGWDKLVDLCRKK